MKTLLLLSDSTCLPCIELLPEIESGYRNRRTDLNIVMVSRGAPEDAEQLRSTYGLTFPIIVHPNGELNRAFGVVDTPSAVLIDQDGLLLSKPAVGRDAILTLIDQTQAVPSV